MMVPNTHFTGNVTCVFVFNHKSVDLKPSFSNILKCLSIFDILFLVNISLYRDERQDITAQAGYVNKNLFGLSLG